MALIRVQANLPSVSALPEDVVVNNWHFQGPGSATTIFEDCKDDLAAFYTSLNTYWAADLAGTVEFKCYDLDDATPRVPKATHSFSITKATTTLPRQVAICLSFQGEKISGLSQARRRGRVYLGPFGENVIVDGRPAAARRTAIAVAADTLATTGEASTVWDWVVYSPTIDASGALDFPYVKVRDGWVDDRFDTIRKRAPRITSKTTFSAVA